MERNLFQVDPFFYYKMTGIITKLTKRIVNYTQALIKQLCSTYLQNLSFCAIVVIVLETFGGGPGDFG